MHQDCTLRRVAAPGYQGGRLPDLEASQTQVTLYQLLTSMGDGREEKDGREQVREVREGKRVERDPE